jgi:hypothetical protein
MSSPFRAIRGMDKRRSSQFQLGRSDTLPCASIPSLGAVPQELILIEMGIVHIPSLNEAGNPLHGIGKLTSRFRLSSISVGTRRDHRSQKHSTNDDKHFDFS